MSVEVKEDIPTVTEKRDVLDVSQIWWRQRGKMSFKIIPVDTPLKKTAKKKMQPDMDMKEVTHEEIWNIGWMLWKLGKIYRFKIRGDTVDMNYSVKPPHQFVRNHKPRLQVLRK